MFWRIRKALGLIKPVDRKTGTELLVQRLRDSGMKIGDNVGLVNVTFDTLFPFLIEIGSNVLITNATVLAHDASPVVFGNQTRVGKVCIHDHCFIGFGAVILPGVTVGPRAVVGANAVVSRDVPPDSIVAGNPAKVVANLDEWLKSKAEKDELLPWAGGVIPTDEDVEQARKLAKIKFSK